jgi:UDP-N-acetylglucosamine 2-epimerase (non-hydrolysing)
MRILHVVGARPNFMKIAPIMREMAKHPDEFEQTLVHTGQHYDSNMSQVFFDELEIPVPDVNLDVGSGSHAWQTAQIMQRFEPILLNRKPDWVLVPGDVNSTIACALVASKLGIKVAHIEAGLRSFDRTMPEEINRLLTDQISDLLLTPSRDADDNLLREGIAPEKIRFVGNVMIDTLVRLLPKAGARWPSLRDQYHLDRYALMEISRRIPVLFPVHPRTRARIAALNITRDNNHLILTDPMGYLDFLALQMYAALLLTDSGGIQEETTYLGIPCLTARPSTERPVTVTHGTNRLVESRRDLLIESVAAALCESIQKKPRPEFWDGMAAHRIVRQFQYN